MWSDCPPGACQDRDAGRVAGEGAPQDHDAGREAGDLMQAKFDPNIIPLTECH